MYGFDSYGMEKVEFDCSVLENHYTTKVFATSPKEAALLCAEMYYESKDVDYDGITVVVTKYDITKSYILKYVPQVIFGEEL
jgi:hypothetical protein